jgi:hypothetical protein
MHLAKLAKRIFQMMPGAGLQDFKRGLAKKAPWEVVISDVTG